MVDSGVGTTWSGRLGDGVAHTRIPGQIPAPPSRAWKRRSSRHLVPIGCLALLAGLLAAACGGRGKEAPASPVVPDSARVIFAGRPIDLPALPCVSAILIEPRTNQILQDRKSVV